MNTIFRTNTYVIDSNGNKKRKKKRKYKPDDIRKNKSPFPQTNKEYNQ